jgi:hypothetical protein
VLEPSENTVLIGMLPSALAGFEAQRRDNRFQYAAVPVWPLSVRHGSLTRMVCFWYFGAVMRDAESAFERFTGEGRARPVCAAALLLR